MYMITVVLSMHDYSRDIMLANAQTEMEASLKKMELAKKVSPFLPLKKDLYRRKGNGCCCFLGDTKEYIINVREQQRLVVLGSTALFTKVVQLRIHMIGKRGGRISYLYRQNEGRGTRAVGRM